MQFDQKKLRGVRIFLEMRKNRKWAGDLTREENGIFVFSYNEKYLLDPKAIPLGPDLPLTEKTHRAQKLFESLRDRIPSSQNPAYESYCLQYSISPKEQDPFILLSTIGSRGPSSFICEPLWQSLLTSSDIKSWRQEFGLSTRDFALAFGLSQATVVGLENDSVSGSEVLKVLETFRHCPEAAIHYIMTYGSGLHTKTKKRLLEALLSDVLSLKEIESLTKEERAILNNPVLFRDQRIKLRKAFFRIRLREILGDLKDTLILTFPHDMGGYDIKNLESYKAILNKRISEAAHDHKETRVIAFDLRGFPLDELPLSALVGPHIFKEIPSIRTICLLAKDQVEIKSSDILASNQ